MEIVETGSTCPYLKFTSEFFSAIRGIHPPSICAGLFYSLFSQDLGNILAPSQRRLCASISLPASYCSYKIHGGGYFFLPFLDPSPEPYKIFCYLELTRRASLTQFRSLYLKGAFSEKLLAYFKTTDCPGSYSYISTQLNIKVDYICTLGNDDRSRRFRTYGSIPVAPPLSVPTQMRQGRGLMIFLAFVTHIHFRSSSDYYIECLSDG